MSLREVDIRLNRSTRSWSRREIAIRALWEALGRPLFMLSPRPLWGWRRWLLRLFGAEVGPAVRLHPTVRILVPWTLRLGAECTVGDGATLYALGRITLGPRSTVSQGAHLCAGSHDLHQAHRPLTRPPIRIGADTWVCADAFIGPGVTVGRSAVIGARAVVMRDVKDGVVMVGNPARCAGRTP